MTSYANATVIFDLDGTLVDTAPDLVGATHHVLAHLGLPAIPAAEIRPWISFGAARMIEEAIRLHGNAPSSSDAPMLNQLFLEYYEANISRESRPFDGAVTVLEQLKSAGTRIGICTNKREALSDQLLRELNLIHLIDAIVGRDTLPVHKPDPRHLTETIRRTGGDCASSVMVGDSRTDVDTARAAGIPVVGVSFGYTHTPMQDIGPDHLIHHYRELPEVLMQVFNPA